MPRNQGVRGNKLLALALSDDIDIVTKLRRPTEEEYRAIFERKQRIPDDATRQQDLSPSLPPEIAPSSYTIDALFQPGSTPSPPPEITPTSFNIDAPFQPGSSQSALPEITPSSFTVDAPFLPGSSPSPPPEIAPSSFTVDASFQPSSSPSPPPEIAPSSYIIDALFQPGSTPFPPPEMTPTSFTVDATFQPGSTLSPPPEIASSYVLVKDEIHVQMPKRSWSLSDLTQDIKKELSTIRRVQSAPLISEEVYRNISSSPSILKTYSTICLQNDNVPIYGDDNISTDCDIDAEQDYGDMNEGRKRRLIPKPSEWKRNKAKKQRMEGKEYLGFTNPAHVKFKHNKIRPARKLKEICKSEFCKKSKMRGCDNFTEECRESIHTYFWGNMNWDQRKVYVSNLVEYSNISRKTKSTGEWSRRKGTLSYFLPFKKESSEKVQVCKQMFLNTLSLGSFTVQSWVKKAEFGMNQTQEKQYSLKKKTARVGVERQKLTLENFLNNTPKLPSHYARKDTNKLYLEPAYHSLVEFFNAYKVYCSVNDEHPVSRFTFEKEFYMKNLSLYTLKKDMCDTCSAYKAGNLREEDYQMHLIKKERARQEKESDKKKAAAGEFILLTMDLESVKVCPCLTASSLYFKTKLTCHNYTVYNLTNNHCTCYWFYETNADLTASTFATFLVDYIERHCLPQNLPIIVYSDGCTYQNRNVMLANALLHLSKVNNITITQKFLEPGHTQMECDSVHSAIERKLKNREIHLPSDYVSITKDARRSNPYEVIDVNYDFIKDYSNPVNFAYKSIRPGRRAGDPQVVDIRAIRYNGMTIEVKLNFDEDWTPLQQRPKILENVSYSQLHTNKIPIKRSKYNHLQQLKPVLPRDCHPFYDALPFE